MKTQPFIIRRVGALHLFVGGIIPKNAIFQRFCFIFPQCCFIFKSCYRAIAVWHKLKISNVKFLKIKKVKVRRKRMRGNRGGGGGGGGGGLQRGF